MCIKQFSNWFTYLFDIDHNPIGGCLIFFGRKRSIGRTDYKFTALFCDEETLIVMLWCKSIQFQVWIFYLQFLPWGVLALSICKKFIQKKTISHLKIHLIISVSFKLFCHNVRLFPGILYTLHIPTSYPCLAPLAIEQCQPQRTSSTSKRF